MAFIYTTVVDLLEAGASLEVDCKNFTPASAEKMINALQDGASLKFVNASNFLPDTVKKLVAQSIGKSVVFVV